MTKIETFLDKLNTWLTLNGFELPDSYKAELLSATPSERVTMLRDRGIYSLPYSFTVLP